MEQILPSSTHIAPIRAISRGLVRELGLLDGCYGITLAQGHILVELEKHGVLNIKTLAELLHVDNSTMSRTVKNMVNNNWVAMAPDAQDKRARLLSLTPLGRVKLSELHRRHNDLVQGALALLENEQQQTVIEGLTLYTKALHRARMLQQYEIREVQPEDNPYLAHTIRAVLTEFGANKPGFAYVDPETDRMYETYQEPRSRYFVVVNNGKIVGGGGLGPLRGGDASVCELQKMYFLPETRGLGLGAKLLAKCLDFAKEVGYLQCYLETLAGMEKARAMYSGFGFTPLEAPMGATGHGGCNFWMIKTLE